MRKSWSHNSDTIMRVENSWPILSEMSCLFGCGQSWPIQPWSNQPLSPQKIQPPKAFSCQIFWDRMMVSFFAYVVSTRLHSTLNFECLTPRTVFGFSFFFSSTSLFLFLSLFLILFLGAAQLRPCSWPTRRRERKIQTKREREREREREKQRELGAGHGRRPDQNACLHSCFPSPLPNPSRTPHDLSTLAGTSLVPFSLAKKLWQTTTATDPLTPPPHNPASWLNWVLAKVGLARFFHHGQNRVQRA